MLHVIHSMLHVIHSMLHVIHSMSFRATLRHTHTHTHTSSALHSTNNNKLTLKTNKQHKRANELSFANLYVILRRWWCVRLKTTPGNAMLTISACSTFGIEATISWLTHGSLWEALSKPVADVWTIIISKLCPQNKKKHITSTRPYKRVWEVGLNPR